MSNTYIILSAGPTRDSKKEAPKALLKYKFKTVLDQQISCIKSLEHNPKIIVVIGYGYESIVRSKPDCRLILNEDFAVNNQSDSLILGLRELRYSNLWVIHGDIVFTRSIFKVPNLKNPYVFSTSKHNFHKSKVGICHQDNKLLNLEYGIEEKWSQIAYIPKTSLKDLYLSCKTQMFTYEVLNELNKRQQVYTYHNKQASILEMEKGY